MSNNSNNNFITSKKFWISLSLLSMLSLTSLSILLNKKMLILTQDIYKNSLKSLVNTSKTALISNVERIKRETILWSRKKEVIAFARRLNSLKDKSKELKKNHNEIYAVLNPRKDILNYEGYFIISLDGINLASSRLSNIGLKSILLSDKKSWERMKNGEVVLTKLMQSDVPLESDDGTLVSKRSTMFTGTPIYSETGKVIAIGALRINPRGIIWNILERGRTGNFGETYAIDENGILQSPIRFVEELKEISPIKQDGVLNFKVLDPSGEPTKMMKSLSNKKSGFNFEGYSDYRGINVIGIWEWVDELNIGIASEIKKDEAFSLYNSFFYFVWGFCFVVSILSSYLIRLIQKKIISRVKADEAESLSEKIQAMAQIGAWEVNMLDKKRSWTSEIYNIFEVPTESNIQEISFYDFFIESSAIEFNNHFYKCQHMGLSFSEDLEIISFKGARRWIRITGEAVFDKNGSILKIVGTIQNVSLSIQKSKEIKLLFDSINSSAIVGMTDKSGRITYANDYFYKISKFEKGELIGKNHRVLNSGEHSKEFFENLWSTISSGKIWSGEIKNKAKDGTFYWTFSTISPDFDQNGNIEGYTAIRSDITKNKEMEFQIELERSKAIHSSKLALIGEMATGMAHEINNPLTVISGYMLLLRKLDKELDGKICNAIEKIENSVLRISKIIDSVRKFSRKEDGIEPITNNVNQIIEETLNIIKAKSFKQKVELKVKNISDTAEVLCDPLAIEQVLVNLISNAIDENQTKDEAWVEISFEKNEKESLFIIRDSGLGIEESKIDSIFNPFFTTKSIGEGTGLGLSISKGIVEDHGGQLRYELIDGHTAFIISLPIENVSKIAS